MQPYSKALKKRARGTLAVVATSLGAQNVQRMLLSVHYGTSFPRHIPPRSRTQCSYFLLIHRRQAPAFVMTVMLL